ncbi:MAG: SH3 domain-containing protein [Candidatus Daviesbacteria bacterium]|nr:SH3 domain-containing protein [Candidatus Daviesbacteria bacterium]
MVTAQFAKKAYLAIILTVAALVFVKSTEAASGNTQVCSPGSSCSVGEFLYDDSYSPITTATCTITSRYPDETLFLDSVAMTSSTKNDGWYSKDFTAPATTGIYRTQVCCTPLGGDKLCLDKTFEVKTESTLTSGDVTSAVWDTTRSAHISSGSFGEALVNAVPSVNDVAGAVWGYSGRTLSTFGSLITDIWTNPTRTLSGFGTLVADVWANATRTLTGATLSSGSLATKSNVDSVASDVSSTKSDVTTVKSDVSTIKSDVSDLKTDISSLKSTSSTTNITNIQNTTNTTNNLLEQLINRPIIENELEESNVTTTELQTKLEKSDSLANQLLTSSGYVKSKTSLLKARWNSLGEDEITKSLGQLEAVVGKEDETSEANSIFGQLNWITGQWDLPISSKLYVQNKKIALSLKKVNSAQQLKVLSSDLDNFIKLVGTQSDSPKSNTLFGALKGQKELLSFLDRNYTDATTLLSDLTKNSKPQTDLVGQINSLSKQVATVNQLPKMNKTILAEAANTKMDQKQLKNKALSLRGVVQANRQLLAQGPNQPLSSLWLEEGSIVFKTLISNPSKSISQKIPLKYYLPKEVTKENITKTDEGLTVNYDMEKDQYFVSGNFTIDPGETKTLAVTVDDSAFYINDAEIATMRKQVEELSKPLNNTAYFAQGVTLKTDIDASLDKVDSLQKNNTTPEARIRSYREAQIEYKVAKEKLEKLKELATSAGSVGTLFGFVGGAQTLAVWGLIIIMTAGFVFLALYMRTLKTNELYLDQRNQKLTPIVDSFENYEETLNEEKPQPLLHPKKRFYLGKPVHLAVVIIAVCIIGGGSVYALGTLRQRQVRHEIAQTTPQGVLGSSNENIASDSSRLDQDSYREVTILVPDDSTVTIQSQPSINSPVLTSLKASKKAKEIKREDIWVKVALQDSEAKFIEGWVDGDFVEEVEKKQSLDSDEEQKPQGGLLENQKIVVINNTPTGFLRVRKTPEGEEITKISPGEQYNLVKETIGWVQIVLEDGTSGWVSKQYISF